jgi:hypothetical protein
VRATVCLALGAGLGSLLAPVEGYAQARRNPAIQPVSEVKAGNLLLGTGIAYGYDQRFRLSDLQGNLLSVGRLTVAYGLADRVVLEVRGDVWRALSVKRAGSSAVPLDADALDGRTGDYGDFRIGLLFAPIGEAQGFSAGAHLEVKLPNSDEKKGIGVNTTDVRLALLGSYGSSAWRATASLGVGILEAPLENFEQNDVFLYAAEVLYRAGSRVRLALGLEGRASTRGTVPRGTEDLGEVVIGVDYRVGSWLLDMAMTGGIVADSPDWGLRLGWGYAPGQG